MTRVAPGVRTNPRGMRDIPFELPAVTPAHKRRAREVYKALEERYPDARCALDYDNPFQLLVATILSAQATDASVNKATPALFDALPDARAMARAEPAEIEPLIRTIGLYRNKARAIHEASVRLVEAFDGRVPADMDALLSLKGVARKTANVVLGNAFDMNMGVVVDTHVERLSKRFALVPEDARHPHIERRLMALFPRPKWCMLSHLLIAHGRAVCRARGGLCAEDAICRRFCSRAHAR